MHRLRAILLTLTTLAFSLAAPAHASEMPGPLASLNHDLRHLAARVPATTAVEVMDLSTGYRVGYNAGLSMPAASTIKVPVMVEVFTQLEAGRFDLERRLTLLASDKDYGSGELCDAPAGTTYTIAQLLTKMIDISDNTATNMLIRFIGRQSINDRMIALGLEHTRLHGDIRTAGW